MSKKPRSSYLRYRLVTQRRDQNLRQWETKFMELLSLNRAEACDALAVLAARAGLIPAPRSALAVALSGREDTEILEFGVTLRAYSWDHPSYRAGELHEDIAQALRNVDSVLHWLDYVEPAPDDPRETLRQVHARLEGLLPGLRAGQLDEQIAAAVEARRTPVPQPLERVLASLGLRDTGDASPLERARAHLAQIAGVREGGRNQHLARQVIPVGWRFGVERDAWETEVQRYNQNSNDPPLHCREVEQLMRAVWERMQRSGEPFGSALGQPVGGGEAS